MLNYQRVDVFQDISGCGSLPEGSTSPHRCVSKLVPAAPPASDSGAVPGKPSVKNVETSHVYSSQIS